MKLDPNDLLLFARVAEVGSFSRAAARLEMPKATVSRRVSTLEKQLGERLLLRSTRKLSVTDFGQGVLAHARSVADEVDATAAFALDRQARPAGRLRVTMPSDWGERLAAALSDYAARYPEVVLEVDLSARRVDLIGEGFDLAIRMGALPDDATLTARRLCLLDSSLFASPAYLARRGTPAAPAHLLEHDALLLRGRNDQSVAWTLTNGDETWRGALQPRIAANSPELLVRAAVAGLGIVGVANRFAEPFVARNELQRVLPDWRLPPAPAWAVLPGRRLVPAKTRALIETIESALTGC